MVHTHHPNVTPRREVNLFHLAWCCLFFNVALTGIALADHLPNTCSGGSCTFFDILNSPLGSATISLDGEQLVISNIGGSGQDGVIQSPLDSLFMRTTLASPNFSGSVLGSIAEIRQVGVADGIPGIELMLTRIVNFDGATIRHSIDCSVVQVAKYIVHIYNGDVLVETQDLGFDPPVLIYPKTDIGSIACGIWPNGDLYTVISFHAPLPIGFLTSPGDAGPFVGDKVLVSALAPQKIPEIQTAIENRFFNVPEIRMDSMEAEPFFYVLRNSFPTKDCNEDGVVNVLDLVCVANAILGL